MQVELPQDAMQWIEAEIARGVFPSAEDAVRRAVDELRVSALKAKLDAAVAEGGSHTSDDVLEYVRSRLEAVDEVRDGA